MQKIIPIIMTIIIISVSVFYFLQDSSCQQGEVWNGNSCLKKTEFLQICDDNSGDGNILCQNIASQRITDVQKIHQNYESVQVNPILQSVYDDTIQLAKIIQKYNAPNENICWINDHGDLKCMKTSVLLSFYDANTSEVILRELEGIYYQLELSNSDETIISCGSDGFSSIDGDTEFSDNGDVDFGSMNGDEFSQTFEENSDKIMKACEHASSYEESETGFGIGDLGIGSNGIGEMSCLEINTSDDFFNQQMESLNNLISSCTENGQSQGQGFLGPDTLMEGDDGTTTTTTTTTDSDGNTTTTTTTTDSDGNTTTTTTTTDSGGNTTTTTVTTATDGSSKGRTKTTDADGNITYRGSSTTDADGNSRESTTTYDSDGNPVTTQIYADDPRRGGFTNTTIYHERRADGLQMEKILLDSDGNVTGAHLYYRQGYPTPEPIGLWDCQFSDNCSQVCEGATDAWSEQLKCTTNPNAQLCQNYSQKTCECDSFASPFVDNRLVIPDPQGDFTCAGDYDTDVQQKACEHRCSVAECLESCELSSGEFLRPLKGYLDNYCIYAIGDESSYDWCSPLSSQGNSIGEINPTIYSDIQFPAIDLSNDILLNFP